MICHNCHRETEYAAVCPYCHARLLKKPLPHHLPDGTMVGGRYRIEGVLGEGGFGVTYLGHNEKLGLPVAIKEYFPHGVAYRNTPGSNDVYVGSENSESFFIHGRERFLSEARVLARFASEPGVVSVIDFIEENNTAYLIMEYLDGETLQQYLKRYGVLSADEAFGMLDPVMRTLEKIHKAGVIHRDISPDNIMRLKDGQLKLMDFGAARDFDGDNRSMSVMLKKGYAPEEQYRRNGEQGPWTDVYGLCATIYRCITGKVPDDSLDRLVTDTLKKPSKLGAKISPSLEELLLYGLAVQKDKRCQSITELIRLLDHKSNSESGASSINKDSSPQKKEKGDSYLTVNANKPDPPSVKKKKKLKKRVLFLVISLVLVVITTGILLITVILPKVLDYYSFRYTVLDDGTAAVVSYSGTATHLEIPSSFDGYTVTSIGDGAFENCDSLKEVIIPDSVITIGSNSFNYCDNLTSVLIPSSVTKIGWCAFYGCYSLESVTIPTSVTTIDSSTFSGCSKLSSVTIPDTVTTIGDYSFRGCSSLVSFTIPDSVTEIGSGAFSGCYKMTAVSIPDSVTSIGASVFSGCTRLSTVSIPDSVTSIGAGAFTDCKNLTSVTIPGSVTIIESNTFCGCSQLSSISIPDSVTKIDDHAFSGCSSLTTVKIPNSVTFIGIGAFSDCYSMTSVTIPDTVTSIGYGAFYNCYNLTIYGGKGSEAERIAMANSIPFIEM